MSSNPAMQTLPQPDDPRRCQHVGVDDDGVERQCKRWSLVGGKYCRTHGGSMVHVGPASPRYIDGRTANQKRNKYRMPNLMEKFQQAATDPGLLEQREEIVIMGHLIQMSLDRLDSGDPGERWTQLRSVTRKFKAARQAASVPGAPKVHLVESGKYLGEMIQMIEDGADQVVLRKEIRDTIIDQEKIIRSERKRMQELKQLIPVEEVVIILQAVMHEINACVTDPDDRSRLNNRLRGLANGRV
jgi:hypothetical protein